MEIKLNQQLTYKNLVYVLIPLSYRDDRVLLQWLKRADYYKGFSYRIVPEVRKDRITETLEAICLGIIK